MGSDYPETRASLIVRLKDRGDQEAWSEFVEIYRPVLCRFAVRKGLQHADAEDVAQQVLAAAASAIDRWQPEERQGRFRAWLQRIAQNLIINLVTRRPPDRGMGDQERDLLSQVPSLTGPDSDLLRTESRREVFRWAARQVRSEFRPVTWLAFWRTAVEGVPVDEVARQLGKRPGSVYAARSRVVRRLKDRILEWEQREERDS